MGDLQCGCVDAGVSRAYVGKYVPEINRSTRASFSFDRTRPDPFLLLLLLRKKKRWNFSLSRSREREREKNKRCILRPIFSPPFSRLWNIEVKNSRESKMAFRFRGRKGEGRLVSRAKVNRYWRRIGIACEWILRKIIKRRREKGRSSVVKGLS